MPKRRNSFEDYHFLQKMHIGVKEVNLGVNREENMKIVYENTYKMLFNGSAKSFECYKLQTRGLKMMDGCTNGQTKLVPQKPDGCHRKNQGRKHEINPCCYSNENISCSFCEKTVCVSCYRTCLNCHNKFCSLCSVLKYDSRDESAICLSCT